MGHTIVVYRERHATIHDMDLWTSRHFLLSEAESSASADLAAFVRGWDWIAPGVYLGVELDAYVKGDSGREHAFLQLLDATCHRLDSFGQVVPLEYLAEHVDFPTAYHTKAQPVRHLVQQIEKLRALFATVRPVA